MRIDQFDFDLPSERIALRPAVPREAARLLQVDPGGGPRFSDYTVADLPKLVMPGDVLVFNDTRVIPARLRGRRVGRGETTPKIEATLHLRETESRWRAFVRPARKLVVGDRIAFGVDRSGEAVPDQAVLIAEVVEKRENGEVVLFFIRPTDAPSEMSFTDYLSHGKIGEMPLPPYIAAKRAVDAQDLSDYQTMFAETPGAVAAPTAGLHFTPILLEKLKKRGISVVILTLHVGAGTFLPVKVEDTRDHKMHAEWGEITGHAAEALNQARAAGGRIIAVGTTSLRLLESAADEAGGVHPFTGETDIFITPGYRFKAVDMLLTNFHLPRSTLFMLVAGFSGLETMKQAYAHAIAERYRFYSYGDACLLMPTEDAKA